MALLKVPLRLVGVIGRLYVVLESDRGLVLMDQHAAHERILYEQMLRRLEQGDAPSQRLLLPETVELSPRDAQFVREHLPVLTRLGVGLPLIAFGLLGTSGFCYVAVEASRLNVGPNRLPRWALAVYALGVVSYLGLIGVGLALLSGNAAALYWLVAVVTGLLSSATVGAWVLLSNAQAEQPGAPL